MVAAFNDFHRHTIDLKRSIMELLPWYQKGLRLTRFRNTEQFVSCKCCSRFSAVTIRDVPVMNKIIHPCQTAFINGRYITDGGALLQEVLREEKFKK
jgi:hypothetical protein